MNSSKNCGGAPIARRSPLDGRSDRARGHTASAPDDDSIVVLHVDDERSFLELAATFLEMEDERLTVETTTDAEAALEMVDVVDCVVSDYDMPATNGLEFFERVRERRPAVPLILYTSWRREEIAFEDTSADVTDVLRKSVGTEQYGTLANRIVAAVE